MKGNGFGRHRRNDIWRRGGQYSQFVFDVDAGGSPAEGTGITDPLVALDVIESLLNFPHPGAGAIRHTAHLKMQKSVFACEPLEAAVLLFAPIAIIAIAKNAFGGSLNSRLLLLR